MIEESLYPYCYPQGKFQDTLIGEQGQIIWQTPWQANLIVEGMRAVLADLMMGGGDALTFWAVGTGKDDWDDPKAWPSKDELKTWTQLHHETGRKAISNQIKLLEGSPGSGQLNQLQIKADFAAADIASSQLADRQLREFGLIVGGSEDGSVPGQLINHRIHPRIDLQEGFTLKRTLMLTF